MHWKFKVIVVINTKTELLGFSILFGSLLFFHHLCATNINKHEETDFICYFLPLNQQCYR